MAIWKFLKYKTQEKGDKNSIYYLLSSGLTIEEAIKKEFSGLNIFSKLGISHGVIKTVAEKLASFEGQMDIDNIIEIYSTFVYRYIYRNGRLKNPTNLDETKILYALNNLEFIEKNGYYVLEPDKGDEIDKKYPN